MREYRLCVAADPSRKGCNEAYTAMARQYTRPFCSTANVKPGLALRAARTVPHSPVATPFEDQHRRLYLDTSALAVASDVAEIASTTMTTLQQTWDADAGAFVDGPPEEQDAVTMTMTDAGAAKMAVFDQSVRDDRHVELVFLDGATRIAAFRWHGGQRSFQLTSLSLAQLCTKTEQRMLPTDLPAP
jgi:hypothetical protein